MIDLKSGFYNSINGDRMYNAEDMNMPYSRIISNGVMTGDDFHVLANDNMTLTVKKGFGIFDKNWAELENDAILNIPTPNVLHKRIDSVIIRNDKTNERKCTIDYVVGVASDNPSVPDLGEGEYRLANITVAANATIIDQTNIEDTRPTAECGFIHNLLWHSDITSLYDNWKMQFIKWFDNLKEHLVSATAMVSFSNEYTTTRQDETVIPIGISRFNSVTDILQVYINGLICIPEIDYTFDSFNNITLKNGVDAGTLISFIVYKSVDGEKSETVISQVNELYEKVEKLESNDTLWTGANVMGAGQVVTPSKKLSECKNGWILVWSDYDEATGAANNSQLATTFIPKQIAGTNSFYCIVPSGINVNGTVTSCGKSLTVSDTALSGYAGNIATTDGLDVCLKAIYEF